MHDTWLNYDESLLYTVTIAVSFNCSATVKEYLYIYWNVSICSAFSLNVTAFLSCLTQSQNILSKSVTLDFFEIHPNA